MEATAMVFLKLDFSDVYLLTSAFDLAVALKAWFALADVLGGQVAALRVLHTFPGQLGDLALVNIWEKKKLGFILVMVLYFFAFIILCSWLYREYTHFITDLLSAINSG